jgi:phage-related tail protein
MAVYSSYTDEELKFDIGQLGKQLSNAEDEVRSLKGQIEYAQAELRRREIEKSNTTNVDISGLSRENEV